MFLRILEVILFLLASYVIISQIIVPAINNTRFFPFFNKVYKKKEELIQVNEKLEEAKIEEQIFHVEEQIKTKKKRIKP
jgi:hypothetical protein